MSLSMIFVAFLAGCAGALIGGTQVFIMYGIAGLFGTALTFTSLDFSFYNDIFHNTFLLPAVIFNGNVLATAYAGTKYDIKGCEITKSLAFTKDPFVIIMGGIGAVIGYLVFTFFVWAGIPADCGAWTVLLVEIAFRMMFQRKNHWNRTNLRVLLSMPKKNWLYEVLFAVILASASWYFVSETGILMMPFYISATSLILGFIDKSFPASHQVTMVASYAALYSGNLAITILFGVIAQIIFVMFAGVFNDKMETHIDPPAVSIAFCSLMIFTLFR